MRHLLSTCITSLCTGAMLLGCSGAETTSYDQVQEALTENQEAALRERAQVAAVADDPAFRALAMNLNHQTIELVSSLLTKSPDAVAALALQAEQCDTVGNCDELEQQLGVADAEAQASELAAHVIHKFGLGQSPDAWRGSLFLQAQALVTGGEVSGELEAVLNSAAAEGILDCGVQCVDWLSDSLLKGEGQHMLVMASSSDDGGGDDGAGGGLPWWAEILIIVGTAIIKSEIEDDPACRTDADCPSGEYCHKLGKNDCRPKVGVGTLCGRNGVCLSNCCKPHISTGFLPSCRPASKCD